MAIPHTFVSIDGEKVVQLHHRTNTIFILGTNHLDPRYVRIVHRLIESVRPRVVAVELCRVRAGYKHAIGNAAAAPRALDPADNVVPSFDRFDAIPKENLRRAISEKISLLYLCGAARYAESRSFRAHLLRYREMRTYKLGEQNATRVADTRIGAEMLAPFGDLVWRRDALDSNYLSNSTMAYRILLVDRPVERTYEEIGEILARGERERIRKYERELVDVYSTSEKTNYIRSAGGRPSNFVSTLWRRKPALRQLFIDKRNEYMATTLDDAIRKLRNANLVCIVGKSHVEGIVSILRRKFRKANKIRTIFEEMN